MVSLALSMIALACPNSVADAASDARKGIQSVLDKRTVALRDLRMKEMLSTYAPDFVGIDVTGNRYKLSEIKDQLMDLANNVKAISYHAKIAEIATKGAEATLTLKVRVGVTAPDHKTGHDVAVIIETVSDETWALRGKKWTVIASKTKSQKTMPVTSKSGAKPAPAHPSSGKK
jgi:hypothetical protein